MKPKIKVTLIVLAIIIALYIGNYVKQEYDRIQCISYGGTYFEIGKVSTFTGLPKGGMCARKGEGTIL